MPTTQQLTKPESGGGLLLPRRKAPLSRRSVAYFCSGAQTSAMKARTYSYYGASASAGNVRGEVHTPLADSHSAFVVTDAAQDAQDLQVDTLSHAVYVNNLNSQTSTISNSGGYGVTDTDYMANLNTGRPQCHVMGVGNAAYQHAYMCFNYVGSGSSSNNLVIGLHGDVNYLTEWPSDPNNFIFTPQGQFTAPGGLVAPSLLPSFIYSAAGTALPTCAAGIKGERAVVSDATSPTYMGSYTSGGGVTTEVICSYNGSSYAWLTH